MFACGLMNRRHIGKDGFTGEGGAEGEHPLALARGGALFHDKAKNYWRQYEIQ
jgi:hypothetical protein